MSTGCGLLGSDIGWQPTTYPVFMAVTASTVTVTTSPVSTTNKKWEQLCVPALQDGQTDPMGIGSTAMKPAVISGQPFISCQHAWPSLPAPLGTISTTASSVITIPARADTEAVAHTVKEDELPVHVTKPEEEVNDEVVRMASNVPIILLLLK